MDVLGRFGSCIAPRGHLQLLSKLSVEAPESTRSITLLEIADSAEERNRFQKKPLKQYIVVRYRKARYTSLHSALSARLSKRRLTD